MARRQLVRLCVIVAVQLVTSKPARRPPPTASCVFPFLYTGRPRHTCIVEDSGHHPGLKWCATTEDYDKDRRWTYCSDDVNPTKSRKRGGASSVPKIVVCKPRFSMQRDMHGSNGMSTKIARSLEECKQTCVLNASCMALDWERSTRSCWLHFRAHTFHEPVYFIGINHYELVNRCESLPGNSMQSVAMPMKYIGRAHAHIHRHVVIERPTTRQQPPVPTAPQPKTAPTTTQTTAIPPTRRSVPSHHDHREEFHDHIDHHLHHFPLDDFRRVMDVSRNHTLRTTTSASASTASSSSSSSSMAEEEGNAETISARALHSAALAHYGHKHRDIPKRADYVVLVTCTTICFIALVTACILAMLHRARSSRLGNSMSFADERQKLLPGNSADDIQPGNKRVANIIHLKSRN